MSPERRQRLAFFALALLLHVCVFYFVYRLVVFQGPPDVTDDTAFTRIAIPTRPAAPPQAPSASAPQMPSLVPPIPVTPAPVATIVTTMPSAFIMPKVDSTLPRLPELPTGQAVPVSTLATGSGEGSGEGTANGTNATGNGQDLLGGTVSATARIAVVLDVSLSMTDFDAVTKSYIEGLYRNAKFYTAMNANGRGFNPVAKGPQTDGGKAPPLDGVWKDALEADHFDVSQQTPSTVSLYDSVYAALKDHPETVVIITDFEDGYLPWATTDLVSALRENHIKLILLSREKAAYPGLPEYSQESGGSYSFVQIDAQAATVTSIQPNPTLPNCQPSADADRVIAREIHILEDGNSGLRRITYYQKDQDARDEGTRQLLLYCINNPNPGNQELMDLIGRISSETHYDNANMGTDASAAHVAEQIIAAVLQTDDQPLLKLLPELIRNTAKCHNSVPTQASSNAEEVVLTCDKFIDGLTICPRPLATTVLQTVSLCQSSPNSQVQAASRYLRFALGDQTGLDDCLGELTKSKDGLLGARLLKRIDIPDTVTGDKLDFVLQHQKNLVFDATKETWQFSNLSSTPLPATNTTMASVPVTPVPPPAPKIDVNPNP